MRNYIPFLSSINNYSKSDLSGDLSAGLTVGVMLIPQGMAYAMIAGLPPIYGLYASTIPLILYALFGTSRQLAVGPVAMVSLLIASGVGAIAEIGSGEFIALAILLALLVGVIQLLLGVFKLGFLVNFLSHPVISGFTSAAALIIGLNQLKHLLGIDIARSNHIHVILGEAFSNISNVHLVTLALGIGGIAIILLFKRFVKKIPGPLVAVTAGIAVVYFLGLEGLGVQIVKEVPAGFPPFSLPAINMDSVQALLPTALTIALIGFMESIAVAKAIQAKHKNYKLRANQELIGLGLANIGGALFSSFPTTGGFSRTAVNDQAGAKTGVASMISALLIVLTLLFLTPLFYYLPKALLASVIMVAVFGLIDYKEIVHLWKTDKRDLLMLVVTFVATLALGIETGILMGVGLSLVMVLYQSSYPHYAILGKVPRGNTFRNISRFPEAVELEGVLIFRFDAQLFFANSHLFQQIIEEQILQRKNLRLIIINAEAINSLDSTGVHLLKDLHTELDERGIDLVFAGLKGPVRDIMMKNQLLEEFGSESFFDNITEALACYDGIKMKESTFGFQTNLGENQSNVSWKKTKEEVP